MTALPPTPGPPAASRCLICSGADVREVYHHSGHAVLRCRTCDFDYVPENLAAQHGSSSVESSTTPAHVVEGYLRTIDEDIAVARSTMNLRIPILEAAHGAKFSSVCEIGCSNGNGFYPFHDRGIDWLGLETDPLWIAHARKQQIPVVDVDLADLDRTFDLIYFHQVLEHIWDPVPFMKTVFDRLNPGGIVLAAVPNHGGFTALARRALSDWLPVEFGMIRFPYHLRAYSPKSLTKLFSLTGFVPIEVRGVRSTDPCWGEWYHDPGKLIQRVQRVIFSAGARVGLGTLLYGYAKKPGSVGAAPSPSSA